MLPWLCGVWALFVYPVWGGYGTQMSPTTVHTLYGAVRGIRVTFPDSRLLPVDVYRGLQYASVGDGFLRFMPPTSPKDQWTGTRIASRNGPACPQAAAVDSASLPNGPADHLRKVLSTTGEQAEECLTLNVFVPTNVSSCPVLLLILIESYESGSGTAYDGSVLASLGHMIVITLNFRLGALGWLTTGDSNAPGNYALLDIVAALHWVRENIATFSGDPDRVTLLGQGHGAALVHLLLISPSTVVRGRSLFARAIIQSGSAYAPWALSSDPMRLTRELAAALNCSGQANTLVIQCLKNKTWREIVSVHPSTPRFLSSWGPVIDRRAVLPDHVSDLSDDVRSLFLSRDLLAGVVRSEGLDFLTEDELSRGLTSQRKAQVIRTFVRNVYEWQRQRIADVLWHEYSEHEQSPNTALTRDELLEFLGDAMFVAPTVELADSHARSTDSNTFFYSFTAPPRPKYPRWSGGAHGDDLCYLLGAPVVQGVEPFTSTFGESEAVLSVDMINYIANFVNYGSPNDPTSVTSPNGFSGVFWVRYEETKNYLHIGNIHSGQGTRPTVRHHYRGSKMALWLELIPKLHQSFDLPLQYHLLDNYLNVSTFDEGAVLKPVSYKPEIISPPPTPPPPPTPTTTLPTSPPTAPTTTSSTRPPTTITTTMAVVVTVAEPLAVSTNTRLSLSVTIAVGCCLLFLNILVLAAVYYQRDKIQQERKAQQVAPPGEQDCEDESGSGESAGSPASARPMSRQSNQSASTFRGVIPVSAPVPPTYAHHTLPLLSNTHFNHNNTVV